MTTPLKKSCDTTDINCVRIEYTNTFFYTSGS